MPTDTAKNAGEFTSESANNILAFRITHKEYLERVKAAMRAEVGHRPGAAQILAEKVQCSDKTTKSWLDGKTAPSGILDLRAMNRLPAYAALKREIAAMETDMDPRLQAKLQELHLLTLRLGAEP